MHGYKIIGGMQAAVALWLCSLFCMCRHYMGCLLMHPTAWSSISIIVAALSSSQLDWPLCL